jgi:hypothetical protein
LAARPISNTLVYQSNCPTELRYIHSNPVAEHWQLVKDPCDYEYSSAKYYELKEKNIIFLKDLWEEF